MSATVASAAAANAATSAHRRRHAGRRSEASSPDGASTIGPSRSFSFARSNRPLAGVHARFGAIRKLGARTYVGDEYSYILRMSALQTAGLWFTWWLASGIVLGLMWYGADGVMTTCYGTPIISIAEHVLAGCAHMADAETPYVDGTGKGVVLLIAGLWKTISIALFLTCLIDNISHPRCRVLFSSRAILTFIDGKPALTFRLANEKSAFVLDAEVRAFVIQTFTTAEGGPSRWVYCSERAAHACLKRVSLDRGVRLGCCRGGREGAL